MEASFAEALRGLRDASDEIASNAQFVCGELGTVTLPEELRGYARTVWRQLYEVAAGDFVGAVLRLEEPSTGPAGLRLHLEWVEGRLAERIARMDDCVRRIADAQARDERFAPASVLVNESGANILRAFASIRRHLEGIRESIPDPEPRAPSLREQAGLGDGVESRYELACARCGEVAATFEVGIDSTIGSPALLYSGITVSFASPLGKAALVLGRLAKGEVGEVHRSAGGEGMIDAYCPDCDRVYCATHYQLEVEYDEGFYDCTRGTCPEGHRRMVDD